MILDLFRLEGKCGLVTGAGSGIGKGMATGLAEAGAKVALAGRNMEKLEKAASEMRAAGLDASPFQVDMIDPNSIAELVGAVLKAFGGSQQDWLFALSPLAALLFTFCLAIFLLCALCRRPERLLFLSWPELSW